MESKSLFSKKALAFLGLMFVGSMAQPIETTIVQPTTVSTETGTTPTQTPVTQTGTGTATGTGTGTGTQTTTTTTTEQTKKKGSKSPKKQGLIRKQGVKKQDSKGGKSLEKKDEKKQKKEKKEKKEKKDDIKGADMGKGLKKGLNKRL